MQLITSAPTIECLPHLLPLLFRQGAWFLQDRVGDGHFANVMQLPCQSHNLCFFQGHPTCKCELTYQVGDLLRVMPQRPIPLFHERDQGLHCPV